MYWFGYQSEGSCINLFQEVGGPRLFLYKNLSFKYLHMIAISLSFINVTLSDIETSCFSDSFLLDRSCKSRVVFSMEGERKRYIFRENGI